MNWLASDRYRLLRTLFIGIILISIVLGIFIVFNPGSDEIEAWLILLTLLFSVLASPPTSSFVEEAFWKARNTGADDVRERLKDYWIDDYLRTEERKYDLKMLSKLRPEVKNYDISSVKFKMASLTYNASHETEDNQTSPFNNNSTLPLSYDGEETIITIFEQFTKHVAEDSDVTGEYLILLGKKGSRKTVELLKLAEYLYNQDTRVPVYLNLFSWAADCKSLAVWLADEIHYQYNILHWKAQHMIENNYLVLLLDGFEEVPSDRRRHLIAAIREFLLTRTSQDINSNGEAPIDLRDSIVIATEKYTPRLETSLALEDIINSLDQFNDQDDLKYLDLDAHQRELYSALESIGASNPTKPNAPVLIIEIQPLSEQQLTQYVEVALTDIAVREVIHHFGDERSPEMILHDIGVGSKRDAEILVSRFGNISNNLKDALDQINIDNNSSLVKETINRAIEDETSDLLGLNVNNSDTDDTGELRESNKDFHKMLQANPFILRALIESRSFSTDGWRFTPMNIEIKTLHTVPKIVEYFVTDKLRLQPGDIGPASQLDREQLLSRVANWMNKRQQRVLDQSSSVFYLEEVGFQMFMRDDSSNGQTNRPFDEFRGLVSLLTTLCFLGAFVIYWFAVRHTFDETTAIIVTILFLVFGRIFGWNSCGAIDDNRMTIQYPLQWFAPPAFSAAIFMSLIVGLVFFQVSEIVYGQLDQEPLLYEAMVSGLFAFALFFLIGGVEIGRRFKIVAHPYQGQRFLLITTIISVFMWFIFFFLFLFWPRARFELLSPEALQAWTYSAIQYALYTGLLIGVVSGFILSHLYIRHIVVFFYLQQNNIPAQYSQVLEHNARPEIGILRRLGGGYLFRHRYIMDHFVDVYKRKYDE